MKLSDLYQSFPSLPQHLRLQFVSQYRALREEAMSNPILSKSKAKGTKSCRAQARKKSPASPKLSETEKSLLKKLGVSLKALKQMED